MKTNHHLIGSLACCLALAACGGGGDGTGNAEAERVTAQKGGGAATQAVTSNPLPQVAPEPGVLIHESFGWGDTTTRPAGSKGALKSAQYASIHGFWVEYPGSKNLTWMAPETHHWVFGSGSSDSETPHPVSGMDGVWAGFAGSWQDMVARPAPTALLPFKPPAKAWSLEVDVMPMAVADSYMAIGLSASPDTLDNFITSGQMWLSARKKGDYWSPTVYEWRLNGSTGALIASLERPNDDIASHLTLRVDPVARTASAEVNGVSLGSVAYSAAPGYIGFEGLGSADNFVVRAAP